MAPLTQNTDLGQTLEASKQFGRFLENTAIYTHVVEHLNCPWQCVQRMQWQSPSLTRFLVFDTPRNSAAMTRFDDFDGKRREKTTEFFLPTILRIIGGHRACNGPCNAKGVLQ